MSNLALKIERMKRQHKHNMFPLNHPCLIADAVAAAAREVQHLLLRIDPTYRWPAFEQILAECENVNESGYATAALRCNFSCEYQGDPYNLFLDDASIGSDLEVHYYNEIALPLNHGRLRLYMSITGKLSQEDIDLLRDIGVIREEYSPGTTYTTVACDLPF